MKPDTHSSLRPDPSGNWPEVHPTAFIDPTALVIGRVRIGSRVFIGPGAIIRADETDTRGQVAPVDIAAECNIQDGVIIHALGGTSVSVGTRTSLSHGCIVHGPCTIGKGCFVGFGAKVFDAACGDGTFIDMGAVVRGVELPPAACVPPAVAVYSCDHATGLADTSPDQRAFMKKVIAANLLLVDGYRRLHTSDRQRTAIQPIHDRPRPFTARTR
ncbi:MAG: carbonate dehydratase [Phycisphaerae bacterium]|nr:carbonate dehydratase [Phycisphaerae bacterium]